MYKCISLSFFLTFFFIYVCAQDNISLTGTVYAKQSGESIIKASIQVNNGNKIEQVVTNGFGFFSIRLTHQPAYPVHISVEGYTPLDTTLTIEQIKKNIKIYLSPSVNQLDNVVVATNKYAQKITSPQTGVERLNLKEISKIPVFLGEKDIFKALQLLPGVQQAGDGNAGFFVRGGNNSQNLILLDGSTVYNPSHLFGFFSTFNSDALKDVTLYKGTAPASYGGRTASILDVKMNEGNNQKLNISGGIGLISSRILVEGPLKKGKSSFLISGRRTYADLFLKLSPDPTYNKNILYFYDLNAKTNLIVNDNNQIYFSGYFGKDVLSVQNLFGINWTNATASLNWTHIFTQKRLFSNTFAGYSHYDYAILINTSQIGNGQSGINTNFKLFSSIDDINFKQDFQWFISDASNIHFGLNAVYHSVRPNSINSFATQGVTSRTTPLQRSLEADPYISGETKINSKINIAYGLRVSTFSVVGQGAFYNVNQATGMVIDTTKFGKGTFAETFLVPEPRLSASFLLRNGASIKVSYDRNAQFMHVISNVTTSTPTDIWTPTNNNVKPEIADQGSVGYYQNFLQGKLEFSAETYFKYLQNQIDFRNGTNVNNVNLTQPIDAFLLYGVGRAYGLELFLKKTTGKVTGWISYTLSRTELKINGISNGQWYAASQDRTHYLNVVAIWDINKKWSLSGLFVFYTGNAVTYPTAQYNVDGSLVFSYPNRNSNRFPSYNRLDISATVKVGKRTRRLKQELSFGIYNIYGQQNAYIVNFNVSNTTPPMLPNVTTSQTALFRWVPFITWNFKF